MTHTATALLCALREAGSQVWIDADGDLLVSPPGVAVEWAGDVEEAIARHRSVLRDLVARGGAATE